MICYIELKFFYDITKLYYKLSDSELLIYGRYCHNISINDDAGKMSKLISEINSTISKRPKNVKRDMILKELLYEEMA